MISGDFTSILVTLGGVAGNLMLFCFINIYLL